MKKIFLMLALAAGAQFSASAQQAMTAAPAQPQQAMHTPEERAQMQADRMQKQFGLSDDQKKQVIAIDVKYQKQAEAMRTETGGTPDAMRTKREDMRKAHDAEMLKVLTPDQAKKYNEMRDRRAQMMEQRKNGMAPMQQASPLQATPAPAPGK